MMRSVTEVSNSQKKTFDFFTLLIFGMYVKYISSPDFSTWTNGCFSRFKRTGDFE